ncbi:MAG: cytochrome C biogenesis protein [Nanoarchaeota archaeon]|nr:cytochrome C biogenesis protein [Nanoarchaeota archaeon]
MGDKNIKVTLISIAFVLFSIIIIGLVWLAGGDHPVSLTLAYAAGLSMIFLPCTLPLVFVVIPLSTGKGYKKGLFIAILFGLGVTITLTIYGIVVALVGDYFGLDNFSRAMFFIAGIFAYVFGLTQLNLLRLRLPELPLPQFVQKQKDYSKAFFMGILLGNAGVGCPNPAFYVLLVYIATTANVISGASLGFVHGLGRVTPLIFLAVLAILGVNMSSWVASKRVSIDRTMGWGLLIVGVFIFSIGFLGMNWWEESFLHKGWNDIAEKISPRLAETTAAAEFFKIDVKPSIIEKYWSSAPWFVIFLFLLIPLIWYKCRKKNEK